MSKYQIGIIAFLGLIFGISWLLISFHDRQATLTIADRSDMSDTPDISPTQTTHPTLTSMSGVSGNNTISHIDTTALVGDKRQATATASLSPVAPPVLVSPTMSPTPPPSDTVGPVVINEIAWAGTDASADDEWLELYNRSSQSVSLAGWHLISSDNSPDIQLSGTIAAGGFYLIERTDDTTISDIPANLVVSFGKGGLSNTGEDIVLTDVSDRIQDEVNCSGGWFAGLSSPKTSMERINPNVSGSWASNWASNNGQKENGHDSVGNPIHGTPGQPNSI